MKKGLIITSAIMGIVVALSLTENQKALADGCSVAYGVYPYTPMTSTSIPLYGGCNDSSATYDIYRNGTLIQSNLAPDSVVQNSPVFHYTDTGLQPNTLYFYAVAAKDANGGVLNEGNYQFGMTEDTTPSQVTDVTGSEYREGGVDLYWKSDSANNSVTLDGKTVVDTAGNSSDYHFHFTGGGGSKYATLSDLDTTVPHTIVLEGSRVLNLPAHIEPLSSPMTIATLTYSLMKTYPSDFAPQVYGFNPQTLTVQETPDGWFKYGKYWFNPSSYISDGSTVTVDSQYLANGTFYLYDNESLNYRSNVLMKSGEVVYVKMTYTDAYGTTWAMLDDAHFDKWIPLSTLTPFVETPVSKTITTLSNTAMHATPDPNSPVLYYFYPQALPVSATYNGWFKYGNYWFKPSSYTDGALPVGSDQYQSNGTFYLYEDPSFGAQSKVLMKSGDSVNVKMTYTDSNGTKWAMLDDGHFDKWIPLSVLKQFVVTPVSKTITTLSLTGMHATPDPNSPVLYNFYPQPVPVSATSNGWYKYGNYWFKPSVYYDGAMSVGSDSYQANGTFYLYEDPSFSAQSKVLMKSGDSVNVKMTYTDSNGTAWAMFDDSKQDKWIPLRVLTKK